jgi:DNA-binding beta-propeller fold protein YncE
VLSRVIIGLFALGLAACATSTRDGFTEEAPPVDDGTFESAPAPPASIPGEVFGHSENTLYRVNTDTREVTSIGYFQGCTHVADIAIDESGAIYGSTGTELFLIETNTARCTRIAQGKFPNSLSFVPVGTLDAAGETLVGFQGGDYVKIDRKSGAVTKVGSLGNGLVSSGDVVSAKGGKTYVTVKGKDCDDCLVEIDPKTGSLTKNLGPLGFTDAFGLAFWAGDVYAFTQAGEVLLVKITGDKLDVTPIPIANKPATLKFWGAGSTTSAPTGPVR